MSDTRVIDTKIALAWLLPLSVTIIGALVSLVWMASKQTSSIDTILDKQREMQAQIQARDQRDEAYKAAQSTALGEVKLNDARQDMRLDNIEKTIRIPQALGRWTK